MGQVGVRAAHLAGDINARLVHETGHLRLHPDAQAQYDAQAIDRVDGTAARAEALCHVLALHFGTAPRASQ